MKKQIIKWFKWYLKMLSIVIISFALSFISVTGLLYGLENNPVATLIVMVSIVIFLGLVNALTEGSDTDGQ